MIQKARFGPPPGRTRAKAAKMQNPGDAGPPREKTTNLKSRPRGRIFSKVKKGDFFQPRFFGATLRWMERLLYGMSMDKGATETESY